MTALLRSDALVLRGHLGKLAAMLSEQFLEDHFCFFDFGGVEGTFHGETDFAVLETVQDVRFGNGMNALIADAADGRAVP